MAMLPLYSRGGLVTFWHCPKKYSKNASSNKAIAAHRSLPNLHAFFSHLSTKLNYGYFLLSFILD